MNWDQRFLQALQASRNEVDGTPNWRLTLGLYQHLSKSDSQQLDRAVLAMIDQDYRNSDSMGEHDLFADVMTSLPAGMDPEDLLCVEAAVLVAAERGLGKAFFRFNQLMRTPRWHALFPRLLWLNYEGMEAQRKLSLTAAGRCSGAILGMALASSLQPGPTGASVQQVSVSLQASLTLIQAGEPSTNGPADRWLQAVKGSPQDVEGQVLSDLIGTGVLNGFNAPLIKSNLEESLIQVLNEESEEIRLGVGALVGAYFGPLGAPRRWTTSLAGRELLESVAEAAYAIRSIGSQKESEGY